MISENNLNTEPKPNKPHYLGHRSRLKDKFLSNQDSLNNYELIEMLLFLSIPRKDVKPLAKELLSKFKNINGLLHAQEEELLNMDFVNKTTIVTLKLLQKLMSLSLKEKIITNNNILSSWNDVENYLKFSLGNKDIEYFKILFLNSSNALIADEIVSKGTINQAAVYPREIIKIALKRKATAMILVHNHPSGNVTPSKADIEITKHLINACSPFKINIHDHVIVGLNNAYSFKNNGIM